MFKRLRISQFSFLYSKYSTKYAVDSNLRENFEAKVFKPRNHPGTTKIKIASIPPDIQKTIEIILQDNDAKMYHEDCDKLCNYIRSRLLPPEDSEIDTKASKIREKVSQTYFSKVNKEDLSAKQLDEINRKIDTTVFNILKSKVYRWANINYDQTTALQYLMSRAAPEYAILVRIFDEINKKYPDYKPRSFFDFGSGLGTGTWAVNNYWKNYIFEYFCVDTSPTMHDLARLILCRGKENVEMPLKGYFQRQFLPASSDLKYNIVLSAFSLFELPNLKSRLETIQTLWNKTEDYLIIVEHGSNAGFRIINEARDFILKSSRPSGHVFAPCPHDTVCPRFLQQETPCNFLMKYEPLKYPFKAEPGAEVFCYVILKKGPRNADDPQWPRVVRAPIVRSKHTWCHLCTAQGELKDIVFAKSKYDQTTYRCARSANWGDLLPFKLNNNE